MTKRFLIIFFTSIFTLPVQAQGGESVEHFFNRLFKQFDHNIEQELKRFEKFFETSPFNRSLFSDMETGVEPFWRETEDARILVFKVENASKEIPFNIKINNGHITVTGTIQKQQKNVDPTTGATSFSSNTYQFQHGPMQLPLDVNQEDVKIEKKKDEVLILFPKKNKSAVKSKKIKKPRQKSDNSLPPGKGDIPI